MCFLVLVKGGMDPIAVYKSIYMHVLEVVYTAQKGKYMPGTHFASSANGNVAEICRLETEIGTFFHFPDGEGGFFPYLNKTTLIIL